MGVERKQSVKTPIYILMAMVVVMMIGNGTSAMAQRAALVAGAATLNNGSMVTLGQPFVGFARSADNSVNLSVGLLPVIQLRTAVTNRFEIGPSVSMQDGRFRLGFFVEPGRTWVVEGSTNLVDWFPLWADSATEPQVEFEDFTSFLFPHRFYRVWLP